MTSKRLPDTPAMTFLLKIGQCLRYGRGGWFLIHDASGRVRCGYMNGDGERGAVATVPDPSLAHGLLSMVGWIASANDQANEMDALGINPDYADLVCIWETPDGYDVRVDHSAYWQRIQDRADAGDGNAHRLLGQMERDGVGPFYRSSRNA